MQHTQYDINITFLQQKGFDTSSLTGLKKALTWLKDTDADCLMHGKAAVILLISCLAKCDNQC